VTDEPGRGPVEREPEGREGSGESSPFVTLAEVLAAAAEDVAGIATESEGESTTWSAAGRPFATLIGEWAEFRLDPMVARAALRTPDAAVSPRGPDWVSFAPAVLDDPAIDRAEAWFLSAYRLASAVRH
jgi:hypothetical protein